MSDDDDSPLVALDAQKATESLSIAEARHLARTAFLVNSLDQINEIACNPDMKESTRLAAHIFLVQFAEGSAGTEGKFLKKLSPEVAKRIARMGVQNAVNRRRLTDGSKQADPGSDDGEVVSDGKKG